MKPHIEEDDFYLKVAHALSACQLVEQALKLYITEALLLAKLCIGDRLPFNMRGQDHEDSSLERLIDAFKRLTNNDELVKRLSKFKSERNFLSHKGIAHCLDYEGSLFQAAALEFQHRLTAIQLEAALLQRDIHLEGNRIRALLDFGEFPDTQ